jgi:hypothetical protein
VEVVDWLLLRVLVLELCDELSDGVVVVTRDVLAGCDAEVDGVEARDVGVGLVLVGLVLVGLVFVGLVFGLPAVGRELAGFALVLVDAPVLALVVVGRVASSAIEAETLAGVAFGRVVGRAVAFVGVADGSPVAPAFRVASGVSDSAASALLVPSTTMPSGAAFVDEAMESAVVDIVRCDARSAVGAIESTIRSKPRSREVTVLRLSVGSAGGVTTIASGETEVAASDGGVTVATATPAPTAARMSAPVLTNARMIGAFTYPPRAGAAEWDSTAPSGSLPILRNPVGGP